MSKLFHMDVVKYSCFWVLQKERVIHGTLTNYELL